MQILFIALIVLALLGGFLSKCNNSSDVGGSFFNSIGFKSKEQIEKEQADRLLEQYLKDKAHMLGDVENELGPLSQAVETASANDKNVDFLRLKKLMKRFQDQNMLLIQDGQELLDYNEKRKKKNKRMAEEAELKSFLSDGSQKDLLYRQKDILMKQRDTINELQQLRYDPSLRNNPDIASKLDTVSVKTLEYLEDLKQEQDQIQNLKDSSSRDRSKLKEQSDDLTKKNKDSAEENRLRMQDQAQQNNDRLRDQLDKMKNLNHR